MHILEVHHCLCPWGTENEVQHQIKFLTTCASVVMLQQAYEKHVCTTFSEDTENSSDTFHQF